MTEQSSEADKTQVSGEPPVGCGRFEGTKSLVQVEGEPSGEGPESSQPACLNNDEVLAYMQGQCSEVTLRRIDGHLDRCKRCQLVVQHWAGCGTTGGGVDPAISCWPKAFARGDLVNGRYEIRRFIGRGGMGEVYEAHDQLMGLRIALKTIIPTLHDRQRAVRKLREEVRNALRVGHPHVCRINELQIHCEAGSTELPVPFFTMEYIEGESLGQRLERSSVCLSEARCLAFQVLEGLCAAHSRGVLHLDLKCDNVMLRQNGNDAVDAVIMDFGLSQARECGEVSGKTGSVQMAGTLHYMPVEQLDGSPHLEPAADVYAFGVLLYRLLTGRLPFAATSLSGMLLRQLNGQAELPSRWVPSLHPQLDQFVMRCLHRNAAERFADAGAALQQLRKLDCWHRSGTQVRWRSVGVGLGLTVGAAAVLWAVAGRLPQPVKPAGGIPRYHQVSQALRPQTPLPRRMQSSERPPIGGEAAGGRETSVAATPADAPPTPADAPPTSRAKRPLGARRVPKVRKKPQKPPARASRWDRRKLPPLMPLVP